MSHYDYHLVLVEPSCSGTLYYCCTCITMFYILNIALPSCVSESSSLRWVMFLMTFLTYFIQVFLIIQVHWRSNMIHQLCNPSSRSGDSWVGDRELWLYNRGIYCKYHTVCIQMHTVILVSLNHSYNVNLLYSMFRPLQILYQHIVHKWYEWYTYL